MSGGGLKYAQRLNGKEFVMKEVDKDLIVFINKAERGVDISDISDDKIKALKSYLMPLVQSIEDARENLYTDDEEEYLNQIDNQVDKDMEGVLKAIDYYLAGDYGTQKLEVVIDKFVLNT